MDELSFKPVSWPWEIHWLISALSPAILIIIAEALQQLLCAMLCFSVLTHFTAQQHFDIGTVMMPFIEGGNWGTHWRTRPRGTARKWQGQDSSRHWTAERGLTISLSRSLHNDLYNIQTEVEYICLPSVILFRKERVHGARRNIWKAEPKVKLCGYLFAWLRKASIGPLQTSAFSFIKWG